MHTQDMATQLQEGKPLLGWQIQQVQQVLDDFPELFSDKSGHV